MFSKVGHDKSTCRENTGSTTQCSYLSLVEVSINVGNPIYGWFMENPKIKWMIWGYPLDLGKLQMINLFPHSPRLPFFKGIAPRHSFSRSNCPQKGFRCQSLVSLPLKFLEIQVANVHWIGWSGKIYTGNPLVFTIKRSCVVPVNFPSNQSDGFKWTCKGWPL